MGDKLNGKGIVSYVEAGRSGQPGEFLGMIRERQEQIQSQVVADPGTHAGDANSATLFMPRAGARALVYSTQRFTRETYNICRLEYEDVAARLEGADVVAPQKRAFTSAERLRLLKRKIVGGSVHHNPVPLERYQVARKYDLFLSFTQRIEHLRYLENLSGWENQCSYKVCYLVMLNLSKFETHKKYLKLLDEFDHVYSAFASAIPHLRKYTKTPVSYMPLGIDCEVFTPVPPMPRRHIDIYSIGRQYRPHHEQYRQMFEEDKLFYLFDTARTTSTDDWRLHRRTTANLIKRSKFFPSYDMTIGHTHQLLGNHDIPARVFEGTAGGSILLGTAPKCREYEELFPYEDATLEIPLDENNLAGLYQDIIAQRERLAKARRENIVNGLLRNDWVYRYEQILKDAGMAPRSDMNARKAHLEARAAEIAALPDQAFEP
jgi:hypothetical protein